MRYIISVEESISKHLSKLLIHELARFDVRAEIQTLDMDKRAISKVLTVPQPNILIAVGSKKSESIIRLAKRRNIKTCFFYQSLLDKNIRGKYPSISDRTYLDLPLKNKSNHFYTGSLFYEFIRKQESTWEAEKESSLITVFTSGKKGNRAVNLVDRLTKKLPNIDFQEIDVSQDIQNAVEAARRSNAVIATDQLSNMLAAFTNCPVINIYWNSLFASSGNEKPIINSLLDKDIITSIPISSIPAIVNEIDRILNDHQHCAAIMDSYQELKSIVGMSPVARQTAQDIVDWLEDANCI